MPVGKQVLESEDDEAPTASMDTYEAPTPSPAVARQVGLCTAPGSTPLPMLCSMQAPFYQLNLSVHRAVGLCPSDAAAQMMEDDGG